MTIQKTTVVGIAVAVVGMMMAVSVLAVLQSNKTFSNTGVISAVNVELYQDSSCTKALSTIDWGSLSPGSSSNRTIYVKNIGSIPISLSMTVNTWSPSNAANYVTLTWNREGTALNAGSSTSALLVLSVSASITSITTFSFNATVRGTEL